MNEVETEAFENSPYFEEAIALRKWDDQAKDPHVSSPGFGDLRPLLRQCLLR